MEYLSITVDSQPTDCGCSPFHPTIGSEAFILSTLATPMPSHDITRELLQFLRDSFSITTSARFIKCSLNIKLMTFCSGHVFWGFSPLFNQRNLIFSFFLAGDLMCTLPFLNGLLLLFLHTLLHAFFPSPGRFWTCPVPSVRRNLGQSGPTGKLHSVVLQDENFLSPQPDPPCFHSWG
jgi:hypothetical protein